MTNQDDKRVSTTQKTDPVRVLIAGMLRMLSDIIKSIVATQRDFTLAGEISSEDELLQATIERRADVIIVRALTTASAKDFHNIFYRNPHMKIIVIAADGGHAVLHELQRILFRSTEYRQPT
jgi:DNA-binding NarL/FixJ family response regulator